MFGDRNPIEDELAKEGIRQDTEVHLEKVRAVYKFHFFFTGLIFAILSFAIQYPVKNSFVWIKIIESISWILLSMTCLLSLKNIGGFSLEDTNRYHKGLNKEWRKLMWVFFCAGIVLLLAAKICNNFISA